jgi:hypothetical protein
MQQFTETVTRLSWIHPHEERREYLLRSNGDELGRLLWDKEQGSLATAQTAGASWTFKRIGFFQPHISARGAGSEGEFARFELGAGGGGVVHLADGHIFRWNSNLWRSEWAWVNAAGVHGIRFRRDFSMDKREGTVEIVPDALPQRDVPLLVLLGWYIIILLAEDAAMAR